MSSHTPFRLTEQQLKYLVSSLNSMNSKGIPQIKLPLCPKCGKDGLGIPYEDKISCCQCTFSLIQTKGREVFYG